MLHFVPNSFWSPRWRVDRAGETIGEIVMAIGREGATVTVGQQLFEIERESWGQGDWVLRAGDEEILRAKKPSAWRGRLEIEVDGDAVHLVPSTMTGQSFLVTNKDGAIFGRIDRRSWMRRRAEAELPDDLPLPIQIFFFVLVLIMWNRCGAAWVGS